MKIELFLSKINQEMLRGKKGRAAGCDIYASWKKECCILDFKMPADKRGPVVNPYERGLMLRKEDVGGMLWNARTGAVYKLDEEAYHTMLELEHGFSEEAIAKRMSVPVSKVEGLIKTLKKLKLC